MNNRYVHFGILVAILALYLEFRIKGFGEEKREVRLAMMDSKVSLSKYSDSVKSYLSDSVRVTLNKQVHATLQDFRDRLTDIKRKTEAESTSLAKIQEEKERVLRDAPELIDLTKLNNYYAEKFKGGQYVSEVFETSKGQIRFSRHHFNFQYGQNPYGLVCLRIGKNNESSDDEDLIKAWLNESARAKLLSGYRLVSNNTKEIDYGEYTERHYEKGDMFFKTYFKYERVQGTYNSTSFEYTFYVEVGSRSRKAMLNLTEYNQKLGS